ncbi:hypothetical protein [Sphingosinicella sp. BN140058]|uniref:DUF6894 family protein n=1 Tax=Sphingosinicella sp. BN140058 TaxID=1892855 RepID=UPI0010122EBA|nr:hypothetical protein [Sphingosinicella sp. BN140058]QAY77582.1 hypothetical protein ETR14_14495 [Sphingosinicella sp. BN140058]
MNRYFLHLHECGTVIEDAEGVEYASLAEAREFAVASARDVMAGEVLEGRLCLDCHIVITDDGATELARVNFRDALVVRGR